MAHEHRDQLISDLKGTVHCSFKNVFTRNVAQIVGDNIHRILTIGHFKTNDMVKQAPSTFEFTCKREEANRIRNGLHDITTDTHSHVWFSMQREPFHSLGNRRSMLDTVPAKTDHYPVSFHFGAMYSCDTFNGHSEEHPSVHEISIKRWHSEPEALLIKTKDKSRQIFIPIKWIQKQILVRTKHRPSVVLMLKHSVKMKRTTNIDGKWKEKRLCKTDNEKHLESFVSKSSDILLSFVDEDHTYTFLNDLMQETEDYKNKFVINFVTLKHLYRNSTSQPLTLPSSATHQQRYALEMLYSMGYVFHDKYGREIHEKLAAYNKDLFNKLCYYLKEQLQEDHCYKLKRVFEDFLKKRQREEDPEPEKALPHTIGCLSLTPLRMIFQPMISSIGNRVLRMAQFGGDDNFLLVHIREEDNQPLKAFDGLIKDRLKSKMRDGIQMLGKTYRLFGTSTSQLKEMSFWFVALQNRSIEDAWKDLGDFRKIENVASYVARIGLFFSTARETNLSFRLVEEISPGMKLVVKIIDDIKTDDGKYNFTDGVGKMSWGLAVLIAKRLKLPLESKEDVPSAYQVRMAGCKGMVAIDPNSTRDDYYIEVRRSMYKFPSDNWDLEICEHSRPLKVSFNNQVIMLLSDLGNSDAAFEGYQNACFTNWAARTRNECEESERNRQLKYRSAKDDLLKNKIPIPAHEGRYMFGLADETGTLEPGQIFIQYQNLDCNSNQKYTVLQGDVIVAKMPCLHPGDVRKFKAVDVPQLRSCIRDCIVFPVKGSRPHPNEMSGSDLDGDQYWVYWGKSLRIKEMDDPLSYRAGAPGKNPPITYELVVDHIVNTFGTGSQGIICDVHLAIADAHAEHTRSKECKELAELFARAVDAPKSGEPINLDPVKEYRRKYIRGYPYFMKKYDQPLRESNSILNKLFLKARRKLFELQGQAVHVEPHRDRARASSADARGRAAKKPEPNAEDKEFQKWLSSLDTFGVENGNTNQSLPVIGKPNAIKKSRKSVDVTEKNTDEKPAEPKNRKAQAKKQQEEDSDDEKPVEPKNRKAQAKKQQKEREEDPADGKPELPTTAGAACAIPKPVTSASSRIDDIVNRNVIFNKMTSTVNRLKWNPADGGRFTADLDTKAVGETNAVDKLVQSLLDAAKNASLPKDGKFRVVISWGDLYFKLPQAMEDSKPKNIKELTEVIKENMDVKLSFSETDIEGIADKNKPSSKLEAAKYVVVCENLDRSSDKIALIYNDRKKLEKLSTFSTHWICGVRREAELSDSLYQMYSKNDDIDPKHDLFSYYLNLIFDDVKSTSILSGTAPRLTIETKLLKPNIRVISLRQVKHSEYADLHQRTFGRLQFDTLKDLAFGFSHVTHISTEKVNGKVQTSETIEFHAEPILIAKKHEKDLKQLFSSAEEFFH